MDRQLARFETAVSMVDGVVRGLPADAWDAPTPCPGWSARDVLGHLLSGVHALFCQYPPQAPPELARPGAVLGAKPVAVWPVVRDGVLLAISDPDFAELSFPLLGKEIPAEDMLAIASGEMLVHGWDIARAAGGTPSLPPAPAADAFDVWRRHESARNGLFAPAREVQANADAGARLLAYLGREPIRSSRNVAA